MDYDSFFYTNKKRLEKNLHLGKTTRKHMLAQLYIAEFMLRYGDGFSQRCLTEEPKFEYPINGSWCTDLFLSWNHSSTGFSEIIEVQCDYFWNISFKSAKEGVKIVKALQKESLLSTQKAEDYLKRYMVNIRKHETSNTDKNGYIGHIAFRSNESLWGKCIGDWEINNESDLERKMRHATSNGYGKVKTERVNFDYISFAVPWKDLGKFTKDASTIKGKKTELKVGCIYAYEDAGLSNFDLKSRALTRTIGRNNNNSRVHKIEKKKIAQKELDELEQKMFVDFRAEELEHFMGSFFVDINTNSCSHPKIVIASKPP